MPKLPVWRRAALTLAVALAAPADAESLFFDDFHYTETRALAGNGWQIRTGHGWPGVEGARWTSEGVTVIADPNLPGNRLLQLSAASDGSASGTRQAQLCHARKYLEGTYAARIRFSDAPRRGPDGDEIVQTFYLISPLKAPADPDYSELDFEYLPNGGWGSPGPVFFVTSWETFIPAPRFWKDNQYDRLRGSRAGWRTLVLQVSGGRMEYFIDGEQIARHGGDYYPEVPMSINFNLWFSGLGAKSKQLREYIEQVDWVLHVADQKLSPAEVNARVAALRRDKVRFRDTVPSRGLDAPCDL